MRNFLGILLGVVVYLSYKLFFAALRAQLRGGQLHNYSEQTLILLGGLFAFVLSIAVLVSAIHPRTRWSRKKYSSDSGEHSTALSWKAKAGRNERKAQRDAEYRAERAIAAANGTACPKCGAQLRIRTAQRGLYNGEKFWGCSRYPKCDGLRPLTETEKTIIR